MKRILIVGNANSIWILNFIMYILKDDEKRKIELLCVDEESHAWNDKYADMGVRLIKFPETLIKVRKKPQKNNVGKNKLSLSVYQVCSTVR